MYNIIGDIHGRNCWRELVDDNCVNIFVGDYFSPYEKIPFDIQKQNFLDIIEYKQKHPETVLLIGNHDEDHWHIQEHYSRFDWENFEAIYNLFEEFKDYFQIAYAIDKSAIVTHAGISVVWYVRYKYKELCAFDILGKSFDSIEAAVQNFFENNHRAVKHTRIFEWRHNFYFVKNDNITLIKITTFELADFINNLWKSGKYKAFNFNNNADYSDYYGESLQQSPLWIRCDAILETNIFKHKSIVQIMGHTQYSYVGYINKNGIYAVKEDPIKIDPKNNLIYVDCLAFKNESLLYDNKNIMINNPYK